MKREISAYVTSMINTNQRTMTYYRESNDNFTAEWFKDYINELQDLLDFIEDIPEEGQANGSLSGIKLREYVEGLEKDNKDLKAKVVGYKVANIVWEESCIALKKRNEELEETYKLLDKNHSIFMNIFNQRGQRICELEKEIELSKRGITK